MKTKTWKLGEVCQGGVITVEIKGKTISIIGKEWDFSAGSNRSSDQSKAKEFTRGTFIADHMNIEINIMDFLCDLTTSYHANQIKDWIKSKVEIKGGMFW